MLYGLAMKTLDEAFANQGSGTLDGRDLTRLARFLTADQLAEHGFTLKVPAAEWTPEPYTRENVLEQLRTDVEFGFRKALDQRGLSAGIMFDVVRMWNWVLAEGLEDFDEDEYAQYGLPLFKATAVKYGWPNPIGDDAGDESKYAG